MSWINSTDEEVSHLLKIVEASLKSLDGWDVDSRSAIETAVKEAVKPAEHAGVVVTSEAGLLHLANQIKELLDFMGASDTQYALLITKLREGGPILQTLRLQFSQTDAQVSEILSRELTDRAGQLGYALRRNAGDWVIFTSDTADVVATCPKLSDVEAWLSSASPARQVK